MNHPSFEHQWMRRARGLTQALIFSGTLNIGLLATFAYFVLKEKSHPVPLELKPPSSLQASSGAHPMNNEQLLCAYSTLSFQDLLLRLENKEGVELGYSKRDLALAILVAFHHFNLERALGGLCLQQRKISFANGGEEERLDVTVFPGLVDTQYQAIIHYAKTEKWPFTSRGLFFEMQRTAPHWDPTLLEAFYLTQEFHVISTLFHRSSKGIDKQVLLEILCEGDWKTLENFTKEQREIQDLSCERCRTFLLTYLQGNSKIAAKILLETEEEFVSKRLDDAQLLLLFSLLADSHPKLEDLAKNLLASPRSDAIWKRAAAHLYALSKEALPDPYDHLATLARFFPEAYPKQKFLPQEEPVSPQKTPPVSQKGTPSEKGTSRGKSKKVYIVQAGDSLWKIARKHQVSIEAIMKLNHLESERLRPGKELQIPERAPPNPR